VRTFGAVKRVSRRWTMTSVVSFDEGLAGDRGGLLSCMLLPHFSQAAARR